VSSAKDQSLKEESLGSLNPPHSIAKDSKHVAWDIQRKNGEIETHTHGENEEVE
jgi:hypothetical protein